MSNLSAYIACLKSAKDAAYEERNALVAALSKIFPAWRELHSQDDEAWDKDWMNIIYIDSPVGQLSWHIHTKELANFNHLEFREGSSWDGHTTEEKYRRLAAIQTHPNLWL